MHLTAPTKRSSLGALLWVALSVATQAAHAQPAPTDLEAPEPERALEKDQHPAAPTSAPAAEEAPKIAEGAPQAAEGAPQAAEGTPPVVEGTPQVAAETPQTCTYRSFVWSVKQKRAVQHTLVHKPYAEVTAEERDPSDPRCSVCQEDQEEIRVSGLPPVKICRHWAPQVRDALIEIQESKSFRIERLEGYRPGRSRGAIVNGLRTEWSNHAFGTAIDINAHHNAIYHRCPIKAPPTRAADLAHCKRGLGGAWDPQRRPRVTITIDGPVHQAFQKFWKWGGTIAGSTRDMMHFSITGQ